MTSKNGLDVVLYNCPHTEGLASRIVECIRTSFPDNNIERGKRRWGHFPNGASDLEYTDHPDRVRRKKAVLLVDLSREEDVFPVYSMMFWLTKQGYKEVQVVLPYFMAGTMERSDKKGQVLTAQTLASMLSSVPITRSGPVEIVTYDIHALSETGFFDTDRVTVTLKSGIKYLRETLKRGALKDYAFAFPDNGAAKRFNSFFKGCDTVICDKVRDGDRRIVTVREGEPEGKHVIIVDDMTRSAGTLIECGQVLRMAKARSVGMYVTHLDLTDDGLERLRTSDFDDVLFTDSCPRQADRVLRAVPNARLVSLDLSMARLIVEEDDRNA